MYELDLEKAEEPEIKLPTSVGSQKKLENSKKKSISASLTMLKPVTLWITTNCGIFLMNWEYQITLPDSWEICMQDKEQQLEPDMEEWFKIRKGVRKIVYCHPAYLTYMQSTSYKMLGWMTHKL